MAIETNNYSRTAGTQSGNNINAVYENESSKNPTVDMFLNLMIAQMQNQDPTNPVDDTQYVTQMAQIATMQQMQELAYYSRSNFVMSLVGKDVKVAQAKVGGDMTVVAGKVEKVSLVDGEYKISVDGKQYSLNQIMEVMPPTSENGNASDQVITKYGLSLTSTTPTTATIAWETPTEEEDSNALRLRYTVYYSTSPDFDTVEQVKKGTRVGKEDQTGIDEVSIEGLEPGTTYYVNVVVKDVDGNEKVYKKQPVVTPKAD